MVVFNEVYGYFFAWKKLKTSIYNSIQEQTYLAEASRRFAQRFIMGNILCDINTELETKKNKKLSNTLVGRIVV